ncbi:hypothetical protein Tco_1499886 [Tanacetum coccineum]
MIAKTAKVIVPMDAEKIRRLLKRLWKKRLVHKRKGKKLSMKAGNEPAAEEEEEEAPIDIESLSTKFPIVDWKTIVLTETHMYYQSSEVSKERRYSSTAPQGYESYAFGRSSYIVLEPDKD